MSQTPGPSVPPPMPAPPPPRLSGMAVASLILGIISLPLGFMLLPPLIGLPLGIISLVKINKNPQRFGGLGFAITGIVTSAVGLIFIPLMIALLLPSLSNARSRAKIAVCLTNTKSMALAVQLYTSDYDGHLMPYDDAHPAAWTTALQSYGVPISNPKMLCPEAQTLAASSNSPGAAHASWNNPGGDALTGSYGMNGWLIGNAGDLDKAGKLNSLALPAPTVNAFWTLRSIDSASMVPLVGDCTWPIAWPQPRDATPDRNALENGPGLNASDQMQRFAVNRHNKTISMGFFDGHAESVEIRDLWTFHWNDGWTSPGPKTISY